MDTRIYAGHTEVARDTRDRHEDAVTYATGTASRKAALETSGDWRSWYHADAIRDAKNDSAHPYEGQLSF